MKRIILHYASGKNVERASKDPFELDLRSLQESIEAQGDKLESMTVWHDGTIVAIVYFLGCTV